MSNVKKKIYRSNPYAVKLTYLSVIPFLQTHLGFLEPYSEVLYDNYKLYSWSNVKSLLFSHYR